MLQPARPLVYLIRIQVYKCSYCTSVISFNIFYHTIIEMFIKYSKCRLSMFYIRRRAGFETGSRVLDNSKHADKRVNDGTILRDKPLVLVYVVISIEET